MPGPLIAVTDSVFPSLDPAMAALKRLDPVVHMAKSTWPTTSWQWRARPMRSS